MRAPAGFERVDGVGAHGFARPEAVDWVASNLSRWGTLARASRHAPDVLEFRGRGTVRAVPAPGGEGRWVVRRYLRGGWMAPLLHDRYLRRGDPRPLGETRASEAARAHGIPTPPVMAGVIYPAGPWYRADLVTRHLPGATDLADHLFGPAAPEARQPALARAGALIAALAEAGVHHPDLNARNFLVAEADGALHLLDFDRARVGATPTPAAPMLARLTRSLRGFEAAGGGAPLTESEWAALRDAAGARS